MKLALLLSLFIAATVLAEDVVVETPKETSKTAAEAMRAEQQRLEAERQAKKALESPITYSGFLVDLSRAERKSSFLSFRRPVDPKVDYKHVYFDERSTRPKGYVLFSLDF